MSGHECGICTYPIYWHDKGWEHTVKAGHRGFHQLYGYNDPPPDVTEDEEAAAIASILKGASNG